MTIAIQNMYSGIPAVLPTELIQTIAESNHVRIERIVSDRQATPAGEWYHQAWDEWVMVLAGSAGLSFEEELEVRQLLPGDYLMIPGGRRHRVEWTDPNRKTIWLAVHITKPEQKESTAE